MSIHTRNDYYAETMLTTWKEGQGYGAAFNPTRFASSELTEEDYGFLPLLALIPAVPALIAGGSAIEKAVVTKKEREAEEEKKRKQRQKEKKAAEAAAAAAAASEAEAEASRARMAWVGGGIAAVGLAGVGAWLLTRKKKAAA